MKLPKKVVLPPEQVPQTWPGAFGVYKYSKAAMLTNVGTYLGLFVIVFFATSVLGSLGGTNKASGSYVLAQLLVMLVGIYFSGATTLVELDNVSRKKVSFSEVVPYVKRYFLPMLVATVAMEIILMVSLVLFIIPFFIVLPRLALTPYFIVAEQMDPIEAIKASWTKTRGHSTKVWGILGANIVYCLLMLTIIGIPFALYFLFMYRSSTAVLYRWIQSAGSTEQA